MKKVPNVSNLVKKTDYEAKISDNESKHIITADYNKFTNDSVANRIKGEGLIYKSTIAGFIKKVDLNKKTATLATKAELKVEQNKITKLRSFDSSYFRGKSHFEEGGTQNYLLFQPVYIYVKKIGNTEHISAWKSKDCLMKVLSLLLHLMIVLLLRYIILALK